MNTNEVRVGLVGVGNCASALLQGLAFYRNAARNEPIPGLMHADLGGYHVRDVKICAAFDVNAAKVGRDVADAIHAHPNNMCRFAECEPTGVAVQRGPTLDGIGRYLAEDIEESAAEPINVADELRRAGAHVLVSYLPVGSDKATAYYAQSALDAGCALVNCIPSFIASSQEWRQRFEQRNLPIIGDDIKSQVGATIVHRVLANLFRDRGVRLDRTSQLNVGGNSDFRNMLERDRLSSKKLSKTRAVTSQMDIPLPADCIHIGPSDHVAWLADRKVAHIRLEGSGFGELPLSIELKLEVWDSPNSAGVVIDAIRCAKLALDRGIGGALIGPSSYFMKSPPRQFTDAEARQRTLAFIEGESREAVSCAS